MVANFGQLEEARLQLLGAGLSLRADVPYGRGSLLVSAPDTESGGPPVISESRNLPTPSEYASLFLDEMVTAAEKDAAQHPESPQMLANLGHALLKAGRQKEAVKVLKQALEGGARRGAVKWTLATSLVEIGDEIGAQHLFEEMQREQPRDPLPLFGLAACAVQRQDFATAVGFWERAVERNPENGAAHYLLGLGLIAAPDANVPRVLHHLRRATQLAPRDADYLQGLGIGLTFARRPKAALRAFEAALHLQSKMYPAIEGIAKTLVGLGRLDHAIDRVEQFVAAVPNDIAAHELLAWLYFEAHQPSRCRSELFVALTMVDLKNQPQGDLVGRLTNNLGVTYMFSGDTYQAERMFVRATQADPTSVALRHNLARALLKSSRPKQALKVLNDARRDFPDDDDTRLGIASVLNVLGRPSEAVKELESWVASDRATARSWAALGAMLTDELERTDDAITVLKGAFERFGRDVSVVNNLGYALLTEGRPEEARATLTSIYRGTPDQSPTPQLTATWGLLRLWEGSIADAHRYYESAAAQANQTGDVDLAEAIRQKAHLEFAKFYLRNGKIELAKVQIAAGIALHGRRDVGQKLAMLQESL